MDKKQENKTVIGVMDSGVGGLSVLSHITQLLPHESYLYMADSQHSPYGLKSASEIQTRCFKVADHLLAQNAKAIVVACNTATAAAIKQMRARYTVPIIGMEPAVKPAVSATKIQKIGVLATTGTLQSAQFAALLANYGQEVTVVTQACEGLVECVEQGYLATTETKQLVAQYCAPLLKENIDTIVLGCTHYPFLKPLIQSIVGEKVTLIDTGLAVAQQLQRELKRLHLLSLPSTVDERPTMNVLTNQSGAMAEKVIRKLMPTENTLQVAYQRF